MFAFESNQDDIEYDFGNKERIHWMTFLRQIQCLLERTYASTGINLEEYLIGTSRCRELSRESGADELSWDGRTFIRKADGKLHLAIYFHPRIIQSLERDHPAVTLHSGNIRPLVIFLEEINHAVHVSLRFQEDNLELESEELLCDLEMLARIDTYLSIQLLIYRMRQGRRPTQKQNAWIKRVIFHDPPEYRDKRLRQRYRMANDLGKKLLRKMDSMNPVDRIEFLRRIRPLSLDEKRALILQS